MLFNIVELTTFVGDTVRVNLMNGQSQAGVLHSVGTSSISVFCLATGIVYTYAFQLVDYVVCPGQA
jgi:hypothetical protein